MTQPPYPPQPQSQLSPQDERTWGMLAHLSAIVAAWAALGFIGPLLVMLIQGPKSPFVRQHAVEALNFNITVLIGVIMSLLLMFVLIGFVTIVLIGVGWLVFTILAAVAANRGEPYRYPLTIRFVS